MQGNTTQRGRPAYPVNQAVLHVVRGINRSLAGDELQEDDAEGEHVRLVGELAARRVLRGQIPARIYTGKRPIGHPGTFFFSACFVSPNARLTLPRHGAYPKVPMTRVETCVLVSVVSLASPKSATWDVTVRTSYKFTPVIRSIFFCLFSQTRTLASKFSSKRMLTALISRWMILG